MCTYLVSFSGVSKSNNAGHVRGSYEITVPIVPISVNENFPPDSRGAMSVKIQRTYHVPIAPISFLTRTFRRLHVAAIVDGRTEFQFEFDTRGEVYGRHRLQVMLGKRRGWRGNLIQVKNETRAHGHRNAMIVRERQKGRIISLEISRTSWLALRESP